MHFFNFKIIKFIDDIYFEYRTLHIKLNSIQIQIHFSIFRL